MTEVDERSRRMSSDAWIYAAAWVALMTIYAAAFIANRMPAGLAIRGALANLLPDALLGIAVMRLPSRLQWPEEGKGRFFAAHAGYLVAFLVLASTGWIALIALDCWVFDRKFENPVRVLPFRALTGVLIYGTLTGVAYARENAARVREQAERAAKAEALRARASLEALRSQVNPHFIFNTYHALLGLIRRDPAVAESALERLGDLLRYSLRVHRDGIDEVPLREECAFVDNYLALERVRLGERLRVRVDTPAETMDHLVPTFAIQILVENSIRHAIAPRAAGGLLRIESRADDGRLRIAVIDEANGEPVQARAEGSGMGLRLLEERLAALYGSAARLTLRTGAGGTHAEIELPARRGDDEEEP